MQIDYVSMYAGVTGVGFVKDMIIKEFGLNEIQ